MENHHFSWENSLFQWPFSIAFCMFTRGYPQVHELIPPRFLLGNIPGWGRSGPAPVAKAPPGGFGTWHVARFFPDRSWVIS